MVNRAYSNPTIGSGLQAAIMYLHPKESENPEVPNSTSGIGGMYTDSESWFAGGFHDGRKQCDALLKAVEAVEGSK